MSESMCLICCKSDVCKILAANPNQNMQGCISFRKGLNGNQVFKRLQEGKGVSFRLDKSNLTQKEDEKNVQK